MRAFVFSLLLCSFFIQTYAACAQTYTFSPVVDGYVIECGATESGPWEECGRIPIPVPPWTAPEGAAPCKRVRSYQGALLSVESSNIHCPLQPPGPITPVPDPEPTLPPVGPYPLVPQQSLRLMSVDSAGDGTPGTNAIDGNSATYWLTLGTALQPHTIIVDTGAVMWLDAIQMLPRQDVSFNGIITRYDLHTSVDGITWTVIVEDGRWGGTKAVMTTRFIPRLGRYVRLTSLESVERRQWTAIAEFRVMGVAR